MLLTRIMDLLSQVNELSLPWEFMVILPLLREVLVTGIRHLQTPLEEGGMDLLLDLTFRITGLRLPEDLDLLLEDPGFRVEGLDSQVEVEVEVPLAVVLRVEGLEILLFPLTGISVRTSSPTSNLTIYHRGMVMAKRLLSISSRSRRWPDWVVRCLGRWALICGDG
jgi:hypothetical protein